MVQIIFVIFLVFLSFFPNVSWGENLEIVKKITNPEAEGFPTPGPTPDFTNKINEIKRILKSNVDSWKSKHTPIPYEIPAPEVLKNCITSSSRSDSLSEGNNRERKLDVLFSKKEDFPEDAHLILGKGIGLIEYDGKNLAVSSIAQTLKVQCIPTRVIIEGGKVFYHEGEAAFKNYDGNPALGREFKSKDKGPRWSKRK